MGWPRRCIDCRPSSLSSATRFSFLLNHCQGRGHIYFPSHARALSSSFSRFRSNLSDTRALSSSFSRFRSKLSEVLFFLKNPSRLRPEHASSATSDGNLEKDVRKIIGGGDGEEDEREDEESKGGAKSSHSQGWKWQFITAGGLSTEEDASEEDEGHGWESETVFPVVPRAIEFRLDFLRSLSPRLRAMTRKDEEKKRVAFIKLWIVICW